MNKKIGIGKWIYHLEQNEETGELKVLGFKEVEHPTKNFVEMAASYIKAEASRFTQSISLEQIQERKAKCESCEKCDKQSDDRWFCNSCGCAKWDRSRLQVKWEMPLSTCPLNLWDKVESSNASP